MTMQRLAATSTRLGSFVTLALPVAGALLAIGLPAQGPIDANHATQSIAPLPPAAIGARRIPSGPSPAVSWTDNFDRANSTNMGPNWTEFAGDQVIQNNQGQGNLSSGWSYMLHNSASLNPAGARMEVDLKPPVGASGPHVALIAGAASGSTQWLYTKIQDNTSDGTYDRIFFYRTGNGGGWGTNSFVDLTSPIATGRVFMYFSNAGDTLHVDIDTNFDGTVDQSYSNTGALAVTVAGTGFGIGTWAMGAYDNWRVCDCTPAGVRTYGTGFPGTNGVPSIAGSNPVLGTTANINIGNSANATTGGAVVIGAATASIPVFWGGIVLATPDLVLATTVPAGGLTLQLQIPAGSYLCGVSIFFQGVIVDPGAARGIANTQGLELAIGS